MSLPGLAALSYQTTPTLSSLAPISQDPQPHMGVPGILSPSPPFPALHCTVWYGMAWYGWMLWLTLLASIIGLQCKANNNE
jgi:hypothetical protein